MQMTRMTVQQRQLLEWMIRSGGSVRRDAVHRDLLAGLLRHGWVRPWGRDALDITEAGVQAFADTDDFASTEAPVVPLQDAKEPGQRPGSWGGA
jgi:hypothetical protein